MADDTLKARGILETAIYGPDIDALERFYCDVFGLEVMLRAERRITALRCGNSALLLFDPEVSREPGFIPEHGPAGAGHIAFVMEDGEHDAWRARLARHGIAIEKEITWDDGGTSLYCRDPAGNSVELAPPQMWGGLGRALLDATE